MRNRLNWLVILAFVATVFAAGCNSSLEFWDDDNGNDLIPYAGSDSWINHMYIGDVPIQAGRTVAIPLHKLSKIRFEVSRPVTRASLDTLFDFRIRIENFDAAWTYVDFTPCLMEQNGELVWVGDSGTVIEYRSFDNLGTIGGEQNAIGKPGDKLRVRIDFGVAKLEDGTQVQFVGDEFFIIWTESSQGFTD